MAKSVISGLTITIGADTKGFTSAIKEIDAQARNIAKDLKLVSQSLKIDPGDTKSYSDKMKLLQDAADNASKKVDVIKQAIQKLDKQFSDSEANALEYAKAVAVVNEAYSDGKMSKEDYKKALEDIDKTYKKGTISQDQYQKALQELQRKLATAEREYQLAENALDEYQRETKEAATDVDKLGDESKETAQETENLGNAISKKLIANVVLKGLESLVNLAKSLARHLAEAAKEFARFSWQAIGMAASYEDALGYSETIFGDAVSQQVKTWVDENTAALRIYKGDLLENMNTFGQLFQTMGLGSDASFDMAKNILSLAADLRAATGKDTGEILESLTAGFTNTTRALRQFGVRISEAEIKAYALDKGIVQVSVDQTKLADKTLKVREAAQKAEDALAKYGEGSLEYERALVNVQKAEDDLNKLLEGKVDSLTAAERTTAIYRMMLEQLAPVIGQNERESGLFNSQLAEAKTRLKNLKETIGEQLLPVATELLTKFNQFLETEEGKQLLDTIVKSFSDLAEQIGKIVEDGRLTEMVDHLIASAPDLVKQLGDILTQVVDLVPKIADMADGLLDILDAVNKFSLTNAWLNAEDQVKKFAETYGVSTESMELMIAEFARKNDYELVDVYNNWANYEPLVADYIDNIPEHTGKMADDIELHLQNAATDAEDFVKNKIPSIDTTGWQKFWHGLKEAVSDLWGFLTTFFSSEAWEKATTDPEGNKWGFGKIGADWGNFGGMGGMPHKDGGPVTAGYMYRVNDDAGHRPEIFIPNQDGYILNGNQTDRIINNNNSRNVGDVNIYVNSYGMNVAEVADELGAAFSQRIRMSGAML